MTVSKECNAFMIALYHEYLDRRRKGFHDSDSTYFGDDTDIKSNLFPSMPLSDITNYCWILNEAGFLSVYPGDDKANDVSITNKGIAEMESRFPNGISSVIDALSKLAPIIFGR